MKTNELREYVKSLIDAKCNSYYQDAPDDATFPYAVFNFESIMLDDYYRQDYGLTVDVWHKCNQIKAEQIADDLCEFLSVKNLPQINFLPTFYRESRKNILDEDKDINHIQLEFLIQVYDR